MQGMQAEGGFVLRAVEGTRDLFDDGATAGHEHGYVPTLVRRLFGTVLGYDDTAYSQADGWREVTFVDDDGRPAVLLAATPAGGDIENARGTAFELASEESTARYFVATNRDRLVVFARCSASHPRAEEEAGVVARPLTDVQLRQAVEGSRERSLSEALTPGQQLAIAKLTAIQRSAVSAALDDVSDLDAGPTLGDVASAATTTNSSGAGQPTTVPPREPESPALSTTLTETLETDLAPAVRTALDDLLDRAETFAEREADLEADLDRAEDAGHEETVADLRARLFDLREEYATARRVDAAFDRWARLGRREERADNRAVFAQESAAVALDTLLLARVAADRNLVGDLEAYREFWAENAKHADRDAGDFVRAMREELSGVTEDATDDGTFAWVFEADLADALDRAVDALSAVDVSDLGARELTDEFDEHLADDARAVRGSTRPATAGLLLDRADYTVGGLIDEPEADLLDPACGDGSVLVRAADRLLATLERQQVSPGETLERVRDRLHGFDVHPYSVHLTETRLLLRTVDVHADAAVIDDAFSLGRFDVHRTDALREDVQTRIDADTAGTTERREREATSVKLRSDFGYVVGDAPTVDRGSLPEGQTVSAYDAYDNARYDYDLSALFLERAADWLVEGGRLSLAVDGGVLDKRYGEQARAQLAQEFRVHELVDFDTGDDGGPLFVSGERIRTDSPARAPAEYRPPTYDFTYARVTPTFVDLVREGLVRPGAHTTANTTPADLVGRSLPVHPGQEPPSMETVLVELDLICDATADGNVPVEVEAVSSDELAGTGWSFVARADEAVDASVTVGTDASAVDGNTWFRVEPSAQD